jgi:hypothetical protein
MYPIELVRLWVPVAPITPSGKGTPKRCGPKSTSMMIVIGDAINDSQAAAALESSFCLLEVIQLPCTSKRDRQSILVLSAHFANRVQNQVRSRSLK